MLGYHIKKINKKFDKVIEQEYKKGYNAFQVFLKSPKNYDEISIDEGVIKRCKEFVTANKIFLVTHSIYLINMAKNKKIDIKTAINDMNVSAEIGSVGVVFHLGKNTIKNKQLAISNMKEFVMTVIDGSDPTSIFIMETPSGGGTQLCKTLEEMHEFYDTLDKKYKNRIKFCVDTCHIFSAGYDIRTIEGIKSYFEQFDKLFGEDKLLMIHLNDSKDEFGTGKDRHENLTFGKIWSRSGQSLKWLIEFSKKRHIALILETPIDNRKSELGHLGE